LVSGLIGGAYAVGGAELSEVGGGVDT